MKQVMRSALIVAAAQYSAVIIGAYWGRASMLGQQHWLSPSRQPEVFLVLDMLYGLRASLPVPTVRGIEWIYLYHFEACLAALALAIGGLGNLVSPRLRWTHRQGIWLCLSLFCYVTWLICTESFVVYGEIGFFIGVMLLTPVLLAMSPLVRCREWLGLTGAAFFLATSLAMLINNDCARGGMTGFFSAEVW